MVVSAALTVVGAGFAAADPGVSDTAIRFGQSAAFDGPAAALGNGMRAGILAAFGEANAAGGVNGRQLELVQYDDGYEPDRAVANTQRLIGEDQVFAMIGAVGTPTSQATQPIATEAGVPFIGPFTGAGFLRDPALTNVINVRASYDQETAAWIEYLTNDLGLSRIAILYQDDGFGRAGLSGVLKAMEARGIALVAEGTYQRNTTAVRSALLDIRRADPEAVVIVGAYAPVAEFIRLSRSVNLDAVFMNISFVGSGALAADLGADGEGVMITQVVPFPFDAGLPLVAEYHAALAAHDPEMGPEFVSLEGYIVGRLVVAALSGIEGEPTRQGLLDAIYTQGTFDLSGVQLTFGEGDNQGMDNVFLTEIDAAGGFASVARVF
ncbi:MAG: ABC transporter substrate-binding protein [Alphaproteobacteria bacterium]